MNIIDNLNDARSATQKAFDNLHAANNDCGQKDTHVREALSQTSAALSALDKAVKTAEQGFPAADRERAALIPASTTNPNASQASTTSTTNER